MIETRVEKATRGKRDAKLPNYNLLRFDDKPPSSFKASMRS